MSKAKFNLLPGQKAFFEIPHEYDTDVALYQGGYGSGKTWSGSLLGILLALRYPGINGLVGAQTLRLLVDTTLKQYFQHLDKMGIQYVYVKSENKIKFENGSEILFRHLEEDDKLKSLNLGFVEIEEMSDVPYATFLMLLGRLRQEVREDWHHFRYRLFGHTNPESARGWIYENFVTNPKKNYRRILAPTTQNIYLPKGYIETMRDSYNEDYFRMYVLGEDIDCSQGLVTKHFVKDKQVVDVKYNPKFPIHVTCDFNVDPMCWYICQHYDNNVYVLRELVNTNTTTALSTRILGEVLTNYKNSAIIINGDSSGDSNTTKGADYIIMRNELRNMGFTNVDVRILPKNPGIPYRINCWNNMVYGSDKQPHIFIHPSCKYLLYNIENLEVEPGTSRPKKVSTGKMKSDPNAKFLIHPIDAVSYLICLYYPIKNVDIKAFEGEAMSDAFDGKFKEY